MRFTYIPTLFAFAFAARVAQAAPLAFEQFNLVSNGNGQGASDVDTLYFTAGINGDQDGLFGAIRATGAQAVPLPNMLLVSPLLLALAGLAGGRVKFW